MFHGKSILMIEMPPILFNNLRGRTVEELLKLLNSKNQILEQHSDDEIAIDADHGIRNEEKMASQNW